MSTKTTQEWLDQAAKTIMEKCEPGTHVDFTVFLDGNITVCLDGNFNSNELALIAGTIALAGMEVDP